MLFLLFISGRIINLTEHLHRLSTSTTMFWAPIFCRCFIFLLLIECITFLTILFGSKTKKDRKGRAADNGRGLFSFLFIYAGSYLSLHLHALIPASPAPLQGVQGALTIYGNLHSLLLPLCTAGIFICILRRFAVR